MARRIIKKKRFIEVYLATPLLVCKARDPKGLYKRARAGEIANFAGIGDAYEAPQSPELSFDTSWQPLSDCVAATLRILEMRDAPAQDRDWLQ